MFCANCGSELIESRKICNQCGTMKPDANYVRSDAPAVQTVASPKRDSKLASVQTLDAIIALLALPVVLSALSPDIELSRAILAWGFAWVGLWIYTLPTRIALRRSKRQRNPITLLNVLVGWTLVGWVGALIWAVSED